MKPKNFCFNNYGSQFFFDPFARPDGATVLKLHWELVKARNDPAVFLLDHRGNEVTETIFRAHIKNT